MNSNTTGQEAQTPNANIPRVSKWSPRSVASFLERRRNIPAGDSPFAGIGQWRLSQEVGSRPSEMPAGDADLLLGLANPEWKVSVTRLLPNVVIRSDYYGIDIDGARRQMVECHIDSDDQIVVTPECQVSDICRDLMTMVDTPHAGLPNGFRLSLSTSGLWALAATVDFVRAFLMVSMLERSVVGIPIFGTSQLQQTVESGLATGDTRWTTALFAQTIGTSAIDPSAAMESGIAELVDQGLVRWTESGEIQALESIHGIAFDLVTSLPAVFVFAAAVGSGGQQRTLTVRGKSLWQMREDWNGNDVRYELETIDEVRAVTTWIAALAGCQSEDIKIRNVDDSIGVEQTRQPIPATTHLDSATPSRTQAREVHQTSSESGKVGNQKADTLNDNSSVCRKCGSQSAPGNTFCRSCGTKLLLPVCPQCGREVAEADKFCETCGCGLDEKAAAATPASKADSSADPKIRMVLSWSTVPAISLLILVLIQVVLDLLAIGQIYAPYEGGLVIFRLTSLFAMFVIGVGCICWLLERMRALTILAAIIGCIPMLTPLYFWGIPFSIWLIVEMSRDPHRPGE